MTLSQALKAYILTDATISSLTTEVRRKRVAFSKTNTPYIVYNVEWYENKLQSAQWEHWYKGNNLVIDIVWDLEIDDDLQTICDRLVAIMWNFQGDIWWRVWSFSLKFMDDWYDEKTDKSIYRLGFLAKETF
jgi:SepF-like predicted cell division protein (DUF552 family)